MKLIKDNVIKDINGEALIGDYKSAGWREYKEKEVVEEKPKKYSDNKFLNKKEENKCK